MSWGLTVPEGWVRGEPIRFIGTGPRYACVPVRISITDPCPEFAVTFDCKKDAEAFRDWWFAKPGTTSQPKPLTARPGSV